MADKLHDNLARMNRSELVQIARLAGLCNVARDRPIAALVEEISLDDPVEPDALQGRRKAIEEHIKKHRARLLSQLPGCTGCCTSYGCPDLIVMRCWAGFSRDML